MNNKGFTLVELLAAVVIMGILSTIAVVEVNKYLTKSKEISFEQESQNIYLAAQACFIENGTKRGNTEINNGCTLGKRIDISQLIANGYLDDTKCNKDNSYVVIRKVDGQLSLYKYDVTLDCNGKTKPITWPQDRQQKE